MLAFMDSREGIRHSRLRGNVRFTEGIWSRGEKLLDGVKAFKGDAGECVKSKMRSR